MLMTGWCHPVHKESIKPNEMFINEAKAKRYAYHHRCLIVVWMTFLVKEAKPKIVHPLKNLNH